MTDAAKTSDEMPKTQCPKCGEWIEDFDGFGVLAHLAKDGGCGYCIHPSRDGSICEICGHDEDAAATRAGLVEAVRLAFMQWQAYKPLAQGERQSYGRYLRQGNALRAHDAKAKEGE